ncbi:M1 family aminopeptidase [Bacteroidota bacterium]
MFKLFTIIIIINGFVFSQDIERMYNAEINKYSKLMKLSKIQYPGDSKIDVTYYKLDLEVSYETQYITGTVTIGVKVDTTSINNCFLDLKNSLTVDSVWLNGTTANYSHSNHELSVGLDRLYNQGESFSVMVLYQGHPDTTGSFLPSFVFTTHNGQPIMWTSSEPYSASDWWPCKDTPADKADSSDVWITVSDDLTAVSNGTLEQIIANGNGTHTFHWKNHYPIAHYLISLAITNYYQYNTYFRYSSTDSMVITHFVYPESFSSVQSELDETDDMIELFSNRYGMYPFLTEKYGHAETEWELMENQTISSMSWFGARVVAHELAHQWYGDMITCKDWHHIWLTEGFATYSEAVYFEARDGIQAYNQEIEQMMNFAYSAEGSIWVEDISDPNNIFNWRRTFWKAAVVLHMLRGIVGDSTFFDIMRSYSSDPLLVYGTATTEDFQRNAESVFDSSLDYFFQQWIYGENYPVYSIGWNKSLLSGETYQINLTISQEVNSNPSYFTMPVWIGINTSVGDTIVTLFNNQQVQTFQFEVIGNPVSIIFDPGNWIMDEVHSASNIEDIITPAKYSLKQNYPNPFNPITTIKYQIPELSSVTLTIYDVLGIEVSAIVNEKKTAGSYEVEFDATILSSGVYFYRLQAGNFIQTKKMILLK